MTSKELKEALEQMGKGTPEFSAGYFLGIMDGFRKAREVIIKAMEEDEEE